MIDADVQRAIKATLDAGLAAASITATVTQSFQPTVQGAPLAPAVVFTNITTRRFGWQAPKLTLIPGNPNTFSKAETYYVRRSYQVSGIINQDPLDPTSLSAYDVLEKCTTFLQSSEGRAIFKAAGIGIDRITDVLTPSSLNDSDQFNTDVSFDFVLSYKQESFSIVPEADVEGTTTSL